MRDPGRQCPAPRGEHRVVAGLVGVDDQGELRLGPEPLGRVLLEHRGRVHERAPDRRGGSGGRRLLDDGPHRARHEGACGRVVPLVEGLDEHGRDLDVGGQRLHDTGSVEAAPAPGLLADPPDVLIALLEVVEEQLPELPAAPGVVAGVVRTGDELRELAHVVLAQHVGDRADERLRLVVRGAPAGIGGLQIAVVFEHDGDRARQRGRGGQVGHARFFGGGLPKAEPPRGRCGRMGAPLLRRWDGDALHAQELEKSGFGLGDSG